MSGIAAQLAGMMANLSSMLGSLFGAGTATGGTPGSECSGATSQPCPSPQSDPSQFFQNATASSQGDPHDAFNGTTSTGVQVGGQWNNQSGHGQLLSSDSFRGGYDVSTSVGASNANGATLNQSASVTTNGGANSVTMRGDGSVNVESNGSPVSLQPGQSVSLSPNETVSLNGDDSLSVLDRNKQGGSINTTMRANADGGVDVSTNSHNVNLGGYLPNHGAQNNQQPIHRDRSDRHPLNEFRDPAPGADGP
ncbi:MAG TPA: hypothetical protein VGZ00_03970 [Candidatus Baltobacteraceae bacterium]|nr:hypothetical protein [Candidatus Baltobacteraceae bacterium]